MHDFRGYAIFKNKKGKTIEFWDNECFAEPIIDERFDPDRTVLTLSFEKKRQKKVTLKTQSQYDVILAFMKDDVWYKASEFEDVLGLKETRTKELLRNLVGEGILIDNRPSAVKKAKNLNNLFAFYIDMITLSTVQITLIYERNYDNIK